MWIPMFYSCVPHSETHIFHFNASSKQCDLLSSTSSQSKHQLSIFSINDQNYFHILYTCYCRRCCCCCCPPKSSIGWLKEKSKNGKTWKAENSQTQLQHSNNKHYPETRISVSKLNNIFSSMFHICNLHERKSGRNNCSNDPYLPYLQYFFAVNPLAYSTNTKASATYATVPLNEWQNHQDCY